MPRPSYAYGRGDHRGIKGKEEEGGKTTEGREGKAVYGMVWVRRARTSTHESTREGRQSGVGRGGRGRRRSDHF